VVVRGVATDTAFGTASNLVVGLARLAVIGLGGALVVRGELTIGTLIAFLGYVGGLFGPGTRLSVGEKQRLSIARALVKRPAIVVLDEATASLDAESEAAVQAALDTLVSERTTLVIAHRLSTVVNADRIVVLQNGKISESGRHEQLVASGGYYAQLVRQQTRGLIRNERE